MREFDIEKAKQGEPVCTRCGKEARIICFDRDHHNDVPIIALVREHDDGDELVKTYNKYGVYTGPEGSSYDLVMKPVKKKMWLNIYKAGEYFYPGGYLFEDKDRAEGGKKSIKDYIGTFEIEVEV